jgi:superfamily II DNA or RNA helicase
MIQCPQVAELIEGGYLVRSRVYAPSMPDLTGVKVQAGDYIGKQLAERMDKSKLVADIVSTWHRYGERRKTICFASGVGHSIHLRDEFIASGVRAEHIDGGTPKEERDATLARLAAGEITAVTNCMVLTEGFDCPDIGTIILARPTKQMGLFRQMVGRGLRPAPGKSDCIILDHSGAVFQHGLPEDRVEWTLDKDRTARNAKHEARKGDTFGGPKLLDCSQCSALREGGKACPHCGFLPQRKPEIVVVRPGDLALVEGRKPSIAAHDEPAWHAMLLSIAEERGRSRGWVGNTFREKFGRWPPHLDPTPMAPTPEVRSYVRSRDIAYAKSMEAKKAQGAR